MFGKIFKNAFENNEEDIDYNVCADYDESIDIEGYDSTQFDDDTLRNYKLFTDYEPMDTKIIEYDIKTQNLDTFETQEFYQNEQIYFFLRDDNQVKKFFERIYTIAKDDYQSYLDDTNTGTGYDDDKINSSNMSLEIKVGKDINLSGYIIHVCFKINAY